MFAFSGISVFINMKNDDIDTFMESSVVCE